MIPITDRVVDPAVLEKAVAHCRSRNIILPTFAEQRDPGLIPGKIKDKLKKIGLWDLHPLNLFRITWKNEPQEKGGLFGNVNYLELPPALTGVKARIVLLAGKWFPTGAHKVGAAYGCLAPRLISGQFDPSYHKAVWPSTRNYCRGGAFDSYLMGCTAVAILPEGMSRERFDWLREIGAEVIATPGCESNVKEIYDKCWEIRQTRPDSVIFNQFDEFGNPCWHYFNTGAAMEEVFRKIAAPGAALAAYVSSTGSAGTIAAGDYLRAAFPALKVVAAEARQCPTLLQNGFGGHRIEGIGDKHVPWVHNVRNTDAVAAIDDEDCMRLFRLFNEPAGHERLRVLGLEPKQVEQLELLGISGIANVLAAVKAVKHFDLGGDDIVFSLATDSSALYASRLQELTAERGTYTPLQAAADLERCLWAQEDDHFKELTYGERKAVHNLKYFTWVEQQGKEIADLNQLWQDRAIWPRIFNQVGRWDEMIRDFNERTGLLKALS